jgi:hypothetical protein
MFDTFCLVSKFALRSNVLRHWEVLEKGILNSMSDLFQCYGPILACFRRFQSILRYRYTRTAR